MSYEQVKDSYSLLAGEDLTGAQYRLLRVTSAGRVEVNAASGGEVDGVLLNDPHLGQAAEVGTRGVLKVLTGGAIIAGSRVMSDSQGRVVTLVGSAFCFGKALETATDAGQRIPIMVPALSDSGGGGATGLGWITVADVEPQGSGEVAAKVWQDAAETLLQSCTSSTPDVRISVRSSYPLVRVGGTLEELPQAPDGGHYSGTVDVTLPGSGVLTVLAITPDGGDGATDAVDVTIDDPPQLLTLQFVGSYPGSQTELKAGDTYQITGTTDKPANAIRLSNFGACTSQVRSFPTGLSFSITATIADRGTSPQLLPARAAARSAGTGAYGSTRDTNTGGGSVEGVNLVRLNNLYPAVAIGAIAYPSGQGALKGAETADVANTASDFDSIAYDSPGGELSIPAPASYANPKTVARIAGTYNVSTPNFRIVATRAANDATTTVQAVVKIASVAATVSVSEPAARLRSGGNNGTSAQDHTISIVSDQQLYQAPTLDSGAGGGTWQGAGFAGGPSTWTRALRVHDNDAKGSYSWSNLAAQNLAGILTTSITGDTGYVLGGFVPRNLTFGAFSQATPLNVAVVDYSKISAGIFTATNQPAVRHSPQGDQGDAANQYTILSPLGTNPQSLWWNDVAAASSNSGGTAQITDVQEAV